MILFESFRWLGFTVCLLPVSLCIPQAPVFGPVYGQADPSWIDQYAVFNQHANNGGDQFESWMDTPGMQTHDQEDDFTIDEWTNKYEHTAVDPEFEEVPGYHGYNSKTNADNAYDWGDFYDNYYWDDYAEGTTDQPAYYYPAEDGAEIVDVDDFTNTLPGASFREAVAQKTSFSNQIIPELDQWNAEAFKTEKEINEELYGNAYEEQEESVEQVQNQHILLEEDLLEQQINLEHGQKQIQTKQPVPYQQQQPPKQQQQLPKQQQQLPKQQQQRPKKQQKLPYQQLPNQQQPPKQQLPNQQQQTQKQVPYHKQQLPYQQQQLPFQQEQVPYQQQQLPYQQQKPQQQYFQQQNADYPEVDSKYAAILQYYNQAMKASGLSTGLESELPAFLLGQNAWQSQTVGQKYYDNTVSQNKYDSSKYQTNFTTPKIVNLEDTVPNKKLHPGIPNKSSEETLGHDLQDNLGFLLGESPFNLPKEECINEEDEVGQCMSSRECGFQNGEPHGICHQGLDNSAHLRVCCTFDSYCGFETNKETVYFKSPDYPQTSDSAAECHFRVKLLPGVCQIRVDFLDFETKNKTDGVCDENNRLQIFSPFQRAYIPVKNFCGKILKEERPARTDLHHVYLNFDDVPLDSSYVEAVHHKNPFIDFKMISLNHTARWNIRIMQVECDGAPLHAPAGCGQYYNSQNGTVKSLDIAEFSENLKFSSCIRTDTTACAIRYKIKDMQIGTKTKLGYGLTCQNFLSINGMKSGICGYAETKEIILPIDGPQGFNYVYEELALSPEHYEITYEYIHRCDNIQYYKYPNTK